MPEYTLTVLDTPGIQDYIFGSNRLRENIGASELVRRATETWPLELLQAGWRRSNVAAPDATEPAQRLDATLRIEDGELDAEVVYIGGGNTVLLFRRPENARAFVSALSRKLIEYAPGLRLVAAHVPVDWGAGDLGARVDAAMSALSEQKAAHPHGQPQLGLSVTAEGRSTGLVATTTNAGRKPKGEAIFPISDAVAGKLETVRAANERLGNFCPADVQRAGLEFPLDFDDFGRSEGELSYLAVVHADGNEIGRFFREIGKQAEDSRDYIRRMRTASNQVEAAATAALQQLILELVGAVEYDTEKKVDTIRKVFALHEKHLPFRPLVFGGDDVTFVCDGRLGLTLAARYLELFEAESQQRDLNLYACAGIAVVKTHYPFARAYDLSQALTKSAKSYARDEEEGKISVLDWHFTAGGLLGNLQEIRKREYTVSTGNLTLRPLPLRRAGWQSWPAFTAVVKAFQEKADWKGHRNKVMALREVLREGAEATQDFLHSLGKNVQLPVLDAENSAWQKRGWIDKQCGYFDAIEALDFYVPLQEVQDADV